MILDYFRGLFRDRYFDSWLVEDVLTISKRLCVGNEIKYFDACKILRINYNKGLVEVVFDNEKTIFGDTNVVLRLNYLADDLYKAFGVDGDCSYHWRNVSVGKRCVNIDNEKRNKQLTKNKKRLNR